MRGRPDAILFTGFPGFIGERLLPRLLAARRDAAAVCVVQARFAAAAVASRAALEARHPECAGRIELVEGDITRDRIGLADPAPLAARVVEAWHLAALYDLAVSREAGMAVNVQGTRHVLQLLAGARGLRRLHYVSTAYVSGDATGTFRETDLDVGQGFKNHYEETKFLAEIDVAGSRLPATIYRPAIVVGDSRSGETGKFDGTYCALSAMERIPSPGLFVTVGRGRFPVNLVPVDFVLDALLALSGLPRAEGRTYHLADPAPLPAAEIGRRLARGLGKRFAFVPVPLRVARAAFGPAAIQRWLGMPAQALDYFDHPCAYDTALATADLAPLGVACPAFASYVEPMVAFYRANRGRVRRDAMA